MIKYPALYKRTKTGAIQQWSISVDDNKILKEAGQIDGKKVLHTETCKGKNIGRANETSDHAQAVLEAQSDWTRKHDEGYKAVEELGILPSQWTSLPEVLEKFLPQFNTDASGNVKPMLAKAVDWKKVKFPVLVQPKLDGVRCLMIYDYRMSKQNISLISRNGKPYNDSLNHIHDAVLDGDIKNSFILDGEIYSDELTFQEIISAVKKLNKDSIKLKFRAYDMVNEENQQERCLSTDLVVSLIGSEHITFVQTSLVPNKEAVIALHAQFVQKGYEGAMIRIPSGKYGQGQRSSDLLKVKEFDTNEFSVLNFEIGQRPEDLIAVCISKAGEFRVKMEGKTEYKANLHEGWKRGKIKLPNITVKHFGFTDSGLPRFPIGVIVRDYE